MDITTGSTTGRDMLRDFLRAGPTITDTELLHCWDVAVDTCQRWIRPGYTYTAPAGVQEFVLNVAATVWKHRDSGGDTTILPDGTFTTGNFLTSRKVGEFARAYAGPYCQTPRVIA